MENLNLIIAKKLTKLRKENNLTQLQLAEKLNYSDKAISKWEHGESLPGIEVLYKLSKLYNVSLDYIVGEATVQTTPNTPKARKRRIIITILSVLLVWLIALVIQTVFDIASSYNLWILYCWAVPISCIVGIVFDSVWNRCRLLFILVSLLIWSILICFAIQFAVYNIWRILLIGIPLQIATILWSKMVR